MHRTSASLRGRGVTLTEMCIALGIAALLVGQVLPSLQRFRERALWRATADAIGDDLRLARAEAVRLNRPVFFRVSGRGAAACYLLHVGTRNGCDCAGGRVQCLTRGSSVLKATWLPPTPSMLLRSNVESMAFQQDQGGVTPTGRIEVWLNDQDAIGLKVAITGRVKPCDLSPRSPNARPC
jgi:Tfp pilus assembly protein FimT